MAEPGYWREPLDIPKLPLGIDFPDALFSTHVLAIRAAQSIIQLHKEASKNGMVAETFSAGQELPVVPRCKGLLRVVQDSIVVPYEPSWLRRVPSKLYSLDSPEDFNKKAAAIEENKLYSDSSARIDVVTPDRRPARLWRVVYYMTGSHSGEQLEGILSRELSASGHQNNYVIPPLVIGQSYYRGHRKTAMSKVVTADIITPGGKKARKKPKRSKAPATATPRPAFCM